MLEWLEGITGLVSKLEAEFCRDVIRALTQSVRQIDDPTIVQAEFLLAWLRLPVTTAESHRYSIKAVFLAFNSHDQHITNHRPNQTLSSHLSAPSCLAVDVYGCG